MKRLFRAECVRLRRSAAFWLAMAAMLAVSCALMIMQSTAMDYSVPLSRVVFLPLSMYGIAAAAFVSVFIGADFSDGFIRNKLLAAAKRRDYVLPEIAVACMGCAVIYAVVTLFSAVVARSFFVNDIAPAALGGHFLLGLAMALATGCLFSVIALLCGSKAKSAILCMALAFGMLFLCMHTSEIVSQAPLRGGAPNPHYVGGFRRQLSELLHDLNPYGQAAQLSTWRVLHPACAAIIDLVWIVALPAIGCALFERKDIR